MATLMLSTIRSFLTVCIAICLSLAAATDTLAAKPAKPAKTAKSASKRMASPAAVVYGQRADAMRFADEVAERRNLDRNWVRSVIGQSRLLPQVTRWVLPAPSGTSKNWQAYRSRFVEPIRIRAGVAFWRANEADLERAEQAFGVPAEIIVGIIGVETIYGRQTGDFRVVDALATLSFDFPDAHPRAAERRAFFQAELEQLLSLAQRSNTDPTELRGSYAGAMGMPQFMPSSWVRYAIDFDADGRIDLFRSPSDAIGSVANYFSAFGWIKGMPPVYPVQFDRATLDLDTLLAPDILPTFSVASMTAKGVVLGGAAALHTGPLALVELYNGDADPSYVAGTENFYTITRYNWSSYYAMAVIELGRAVAQSMGR